MLEEEEILIIMLFVVLIMTQENVIEDSIMVVGNVVISLHEQMPNNDSRSMQFQR